MVLAQSSRQQAPVPAVQRICDVGGALTCTVGCVWAHPTEQPHPLVCQHQPSAVSTCACTWLLVLLLLLQQQHDGCFKDGGM
jgi:hypothetical protein